MLIVYFFFGGGDVDCWCLTKAMFGNMFVLLLLVTENVHCTSVIEFWTSILGDILLVF